MDDKATRQRILRELLQTVKETGAFPENKTFRLNHEKERNIINELIQHKLVVLWAERYVLTLSGVRAISGPEARAEIQMVAGLFRALQDAYREQPNKIWTPSELSVRFGKWDELETRRALTYLSVELPIFEKWDHEEKTALTADVTIDENVLDLSVVAIIGAPWDEDNPIEPSAVRFREIKINGYRIFREFEAELGDLTVVIGANGTGKSSLFEFLDFLSQAVVDPLPPEIDERSAGKLLFHAGGPERLSVAASLDIGRPLPVRYEVEILGPVGTPVVSREVLMALDESAEEPFEFLRASGRHATIRHQREGVLALNPRSVQPHELALRHAVDPELVTQSQVRSFLSSLRVYTGFEMASGREIGRPVPTEPEPILAPDGGNLSAVLMWLRTKHDDVWSELETHLRSAIPGFRSLNVEPSGGRGTIMGTWREEGLREQLNLADLSDGTLRFLCWAALCLSPKIPSLLCVDEPELGLHPRVLPILAALFQLASDRTQVVITTHSPYFLSQFELDDMAVMRKEEDRAVFVRPISSAALRSAVEEVGGETLVNLFLSEELETLP